MAMIPPYNPNQYRSRGGSDDPRTRWRTNFAYVDPRDQLQRSQEGIAGAYNTATRSLGALSPQAQAQERSRLAVSQAGAAASAARDAYSDATRQNMSYDVERRSQELQKELEQGRQGLTAQEIALKGELGRGQLAQGEKDIALRGELGRGELGLRGELGRGQLAQGERELGLRERLGLGELGISQQRANTEQELGRGGLDVERGRLGLSREELAQRGQLTREELAQRESQFGRQLGQTAEQAAAERASRERLGFGEQEISRRGQDIQAALERYGLETNEARSIAELMLRQEELGQSSEASRRQAELQRYGIDVGARTNEEQQLQQMMSDLLRYRLGRETTPSADIQEQIMRLNAMMNAANMG